MMNDEIMTNNEEMTTAEIDNLLLQAFDHACETIMTDSTKEASIRLARAYFGEHTDENSIAGRLMIGFYMGVHEGMRIMAAINGDSEYLAQCDHLDA